MKPNILQDNLKNEKIYPQPDNVIIKYGKNGEIYLRRLCKI